MGPQRYWESLGLLNWALPASLGRLGGAFLCCQAGDCSCSKVRAQRVDGSASPLFLRQFCHIWGGAGLCPPPTFVRSYIWHWVFPASLLDFAPSWPVKGPQPRDTSARPAARRAGAMGRVRLASQMGKLRHRERVIGGGDQNPSDNEEPLHHVGFSPFSKWADRKIGIEGGGVQVCYRFVSPPPRMQGDTEELHHSKLPHVDPSWWQPSPAPPRAVLLCPPSPPSRLFENPCEWNHTAYNHPWSSAS